MILVPLFQISLQYLKNACFLNFLKSECSSTWYCRWLFIAHSSNLKIICKSPCKYLKSHLDLKFHSARNWVLQWELFVHSLWSRGQGFNKQKVKTVDLQTISFSIDYGVSHPLFNHLWKFSTDFFWNKWIQILIHPYSTPFYPVSTKVDRYQRFTINTVHHLLKSFRFQRVMVWEYLEVSFYCKV